MYTTCQVCNEKFHLCNCVSDRLNFVKAIEFSEWLRAEINKKFSSQAEFAEKSKLSPSQISRILNMTSTPSGEALRGIAKALGYPVDYVFVQAGLLPDQIEMDKDTQEMIHLFTQMSDEDREAAISMARFFVERRANKKPGQARPAEV